MVWSGFFTGLMDYQKEVDENKKYKEAFKLKQDAFDLQLEQFELEKEALESEKQNKRDANFIDMMEIIRKNGGFGAGSTVGYGEGEMYDTSGKYRGPDNAHYMQQILTEFPNVDKNALSKVYGASNLASNVGYRLYNALTALRDIKPDKRLSVEDVSSFFNNVVVTEVTPNNPFSNIDTKDVSPYLKDMLSLYENKTFSQITFPTATEAVEISEIGEKNAESTIHKFLVDKQKRDMEALLARQTTLTNKKNRSDIERLELEFIIQRSTLLESLDLSPDNPLKLFETYGSKLQYERYKPIYSKTYPGKKLPDIALNPSLNISRVPIKFESKHIMIDKDRTSETYNQPDNAVGFINYLVAKGLLEYGHPVILPDGTIGKAE